MEQERFAIVFKKLSETSLANDKEVKANGDAAELLLSEAREIAELRKMVLEVIEPEPNFYTGT